MAEPAADGEPRRVGALPRTVAFTPAGDHLPPAVAEFTGRSAECAQLRREIDRPGMRPPGEVGLAAESSRVLVIAGRPGTGRTALAVRLGRALAREYPDGQLFVRLTDVHGEPLSAARIAAGLLDQLGVALPPGIGEQVDAGADDDTGDVGEVPAETGGGRAGEEQDGADTAQADGAPRDPVFGLVRRALADRRLLLVLDDAVDAPQLLPILPTHAGCLVIATTRGPLTGLRDARPCIIGGLDRPSAVTLLGRHVDATRLVCDPSAAEQLAEVCGRRPRALRLMAHWLRDRPRAAVPEAVRRVLAVGGDDEPIRRCFQVVYQDLAPWAARLARMLVLVPADVLSPQEAAALTGYSRKAAEAGLHALADLGVLEAAIGPAPPTGPPPVLYRIPPCLREQLTERLHQLERPAEIELARARLFERCARLLHSCHVALVPSPEPHQVITPQLRFDSSARARWWLHQQLPLLLTVAERAVRDGGLDGVAHRLVTTLVRLLSADQARLPYTVPPPGGAFRPERYRLHILVLSLARRAEDHARVGAGLVNLADLDAGAGRHALALRRYRAALDAVRTVGDGAAEGQVLEALAHTHRTLGDLPRAADWYRRALDLRLARDELRPQARLLAYLATVDAQRGYPRRALRGRRGQLGIHRRLGERGRAARALLEVAVLEERTGQGEEALRACRSVIDAARALQDRRLEAAALLRAAQVLERACDAGGARVHREQAAHCLAAIRAEQGEDGADSAPGRVAADTQSPHTQSCVPDGQQDGSGGQGVEAAARTVSVPAGRMAPVPAQAEPSDSGPSSGDAL